MKIVTPHLGELEFSPGDAVHFPQGLPGFPLHRQFLVVQPAQIKPLSYLQSLEEPGLAFLLAPVPLVDPEYSLSIDETDQAILGASDEHQSLDAHFVISAHAGAPPTVNMLAPILIRWNARIGVQAIRPDSIYPHAKTLTRLVDCPPQQVAQC